MRAYLRENIVVPFVLNQASSEARLKIMRMSDGLWLDFSDATFKDSGWATDYGVMTADSNVVWKYSWITPNSEEKYQVVFVDVDSGFQYAGPVIEVSGSVVFTVQADAGNMATTFKTDLPETVNDHYIAPALVRFFTGVLKGQVRRLAVSGGFNGTTKFITPAAGFTAAPTAGDKGVIINI